MCNMCVSSKKIRFGDVNTMMMLFNVCCAYIDWDILMWWFFSFVFVVRIYRLCDVKTDDHTKYM